MSELLNILKHGRMKSVAGSWIHIIYQSQFLTKNHLKRQSWEQKDYSSIREFKKLHQKTRNYGNWWTGSESTNCQLQKPFNSMDTCLYIKLEDLWQALDQTFNSAQNQHINLYLLDKVPSKFVSE